MTPFDPSTTRRLYFQYKSGYGHVLDKQWTFATKVFNDPRLTRKLYGYAVGRCIALMGKTCGKINP